MTIMCLTYIILSVCHMAVSLSMYQSKDLPLEVGMDDIEICVRLKTIAQESFSLLISRSCSTKCLRA